MTCVSASESQKLTTEAEAKGAIIYRLKGDHADDRASFFDAVRATLPLDPPFVGSYSWDALSDSIWGGLDGLETHRILKIWSNSDQLKESPKDFEFALSVLRQVTKTIASEELIAGSPKEVTVLLT